MPDAQFARISNRILVRGAPGAQTARTSMRTLTAFIPTTALMARTSLRMLVPRRAIMVNVWDGTAWVKEPLMEWGGSQFVDPEAVKVWNGSAFVDAI